MGCNELSMCTSVGKLASLKSPLEGWITSFESNWFEWMKPFNPQFVWLCWKQILLLLFLLYFCVAAQGLFWHGSKTHLSLTPENTSVSKSSRTEILRIITLSHDFCETHYRRGCLRQVRSHSWNTELLGFCIDKLHLSFQFACEELWLDVDLKVDLKG